MHSVILPLLVKVIIITRRQYTRPVWYL